MRASVKNIQFYSNAIEILNNTFFMCKMIQETGLKLDFKKIIKFMQEIHLNNLPVWLHITLLTNTLYFVTTTCIK